MILVSMCDGGGLRTLDDQEIFPGDSRGLAYWRGYVFFLSGSSRYRRGLYRLEPDMQVYPVKREQVDWHGMHAIDDALLCCDNTRPYRWNPRTNEREILAIKGGGHINDCTAHPATGEILISRFKRGVITLEDEILHGPYDQPHTLVYDRDGRLWHCDSNQGRILIDGHEWLRVEGYARGIAFEDDTVLVGVSGDRHNAKRGQAHIIRCEPGGRELERYQFKGPEIYAIASVPFATAST